MNFFNQGQHALVNLTAAKLRSFLAILGILVGTAAVVALISCSQLATEKALAQFKALGTDLLAISVYQRKTAFLMRTLTSPSLFLWPGCAW
jgi:putative ABC transport system permease protein